MKNRETKKKLKVQLDLEEERKTLCLTELQRYYFLTSTSEHDRYIELAKQQNYTKIKYKDKVLWEKT